jgi:hypothetical protein
MSRLMSEAKPVARRQHTCDWCFSKVEAGQRYRTLRVLDDYGFHTWKCCLPCLAMAPKVQKWTWDDEEGMSADDFLEWAHEHEEDPDATAFLVRRSTR